MALLLICAAQMVLSRKLNRQSADNRALRHEVAILRDKLDAWSECGDALEARGISLDTEGETVE